MARSFEEGSGGKDDDKKGGGGYSHPVGAAALPALPPVEVDSDSTDPNISGSGDDSDVPQLPVIEEVAEEGQQLYLDFIRSEIRSNGLNDDCIDVSDGSAVRPEKTLEWIRAGRELRQLADAFSRSKERDAVRRKASKVPVESLDVDHFMNLLQELFQGGTITRERIVVLFFFCADVAIQALRQGLHRTFHRLVEWSLRYIATHVASWVHSCGGWGVVLRSSLDVVYQLSACCAFVAVVAACVVYIKRNL